MENTTAQELSGYLDSVNDRMNSDYEKIVSLIRKLIDAEQDQMKKSYLQWSITHIHDDFVKTHIGLKNLQKAIR